ncbi:MAG: hypothetical protein U9P37_06930 [Pseudomonadota bacterium]|nr:hypothetical protein [Pseudomonadota bacterium]
MKKIITLIITLALLTACADHSSKCTNNTIPTPPEKHHVKNAGTDSTLPPPAEKAEAGTFAATAIVAGSSILNFVGTIFTVAGDVATGHPVAAVLDLTSGLDAQ